LGSSPLWGEVVREANRRGVTTESSYERRGVATGETVKGIQPFL
jgi:hypothetical protein